MAKERKQALPPPKFTKRDTELFKTLYECDGLTTHQISALFYPLDVHPEKRVFPIQTSHSNCLKRLLQLYEFEYIERTEQPVERSRGTKDYIHRLSKKGIAQLAQWLGVQPSELVYHPWRSPKDEFLEHFIRRNDVRVSLTLASAKYNANLVTWHTERYFKRHPLIVSSHQATTQEKAPEVEPDDYFLLHTNNPEPHDYHRFIEIDNATTTGVSGHDLYRSWSRKVGLYLEYYNSGEYTRRFNSRGMCVLTVTTSEARLQNLVQATIKAGGQARFWFSIFDKVTSESVLTKPIWQMAGRSEEALVSLVWDKQGNRPPKKLPGLPSRQK